MYETREKKLKFSYCINHDYSSVERPCCLTLLNVGTTWALKFKISVKTRDFFYFFIIT